MNLQFPLCIATIYVFVNSLCWFSILCHRETRITWRPVLNEHVLISTILCFCLMRICSGDIHICFVFLRLGTEKRLWPTKEPGNMFKVKKTAAVIGPTSSFYDTEAVPKIQFQLRSQGDTGQLTTRPKLERVHYHACANFELRPDPGVIHMYCVDFGCIVQRYAYAKIATLQCDALKNMWNTFKRESHSYNTHKHVQYTVFHKAQYCV